MHQRVPHVGGNVEFMLVYDFNITAYTRDPLDYLSLLTDILFE